MNFYCFFYSPTIYYKIGWVTSLSSRSMKSSKKVYNKMYQYQWILKYHITLNEWMNVDQWKRNSINAKRLNYKTCLLVSFGVDSNNDKLRNDSLLEKIWKLIFFQSLHNNNVIMMIFSCLTFFGSFDLLLLNKIIFNYLFGRNKFLKERNKTKVDQKFNEVKMILVEFSLLYLFFGCRSIPRK